MFLEIEFTSYMWQKVFLYGSEMLKNFVGLHSACLFCKIYMHIIPKSHSHKRVIKNLELFIISFSLHVVTACGHHQLKQINYCQVSQDSLILLLKCNAL
jgi:hypothetical protein